MQMVTKSRLIVGLIGAIILAPISANAVISSQSPISNLSLHQRLHNGNSCGSNDECRSRNCDKQIF